MLVLVEHAVMRRRLVLKKEFFRCVMSSDSGIRSDNGQSSGIFSMVRLIREKTFACSLYPIGQSWTSGTILNGKILRFLLSTSVTKERWYGATANGWQQLHVFISTKRMLWNVDTCVSGQ